MGNVLSCVEGGTGVGQRIKVFCVPRDLKNASYAKDMKDWQYGFLIYEESGNTGKVDVLFDDPRFGIDSFKFTEPRPVPMNQEAFYLAARRGVLEAVKGYLENSEVDVDDEKLEDGTTAFHNACAEGRLEVARWLVGAGGADAGRPDYRGRGGAAHALAGGHWETAAYARFGAAEEGRGGGGAAAAAAAAAAEADFLAALGGRCPDLDTKQKMFMKVEDFDCLEGFKTNREVAQKLVAPDAVRNGDGVLYLATSPRAGEGGRGPAQYAAARAFLARAGPSAFRYVFEPALCLPAPAAGGAGPARRLHAAIRANAVLILPPDKQLATADGTKIVITDLKSTLSDPWTMSDVLCNLITNSKPYICYSLGDLKHVAELGGARLHRDEDPSAFFGAEELCAFRSGLLMAAREAGVAMAEASQSDSKESMTPAQYAALVKGLWFDEQEAGEEGPFAPWDPTARLARFWAALAAAEGEMRHERDVLRGVAGAVACRPVAGGKRPPPGGRHLRALAAALGAGPQGEGGGGGEDPGPAGPLLAALYFCRGPASLALLDAPVVPRPPKATAKDKQRRSRRRRGSGDEEGGQEGEEGGGGGGPAEGGQSAEDVPHSKTEGAAKDGAEEENNTREEPVADTEQRSQERAQDAQAETGGKGGCKCTLM